MRRVSGWMKHICWVIMSCQLFVVSACAEKPILSEQIYDPTTALPMRTHVSPAQLEMVLTRAGISLIEDPSLCKDGDETSIYLFESGSLQNAFGVEGQDLISLSAGVCNQPDWVRQDHLFLYASGQIKTHWQNHCSDITAVMHDEDGKQQVVMTCYGGNRGEVVMSAEIIGFENGQLVLVAKVDDLYLNDCNGFGEKGIRYKVLDFQTGQVSVTEKKRSCE